MVKDFEFERAEKNIRELWPGKERSENQLMGVIVRLTEGLGWERDDMDGGRWFSVPRQEYLLLLMRVGAQLGEALKGGTSAVDEFILFLRRELEGVKLL